MRITAYLRNFYKDAQATLDFFAPRAFFESLRMLSLFRKVRRHTKVRIPRLKMLYRLTKELDAKGIPGDIMEFGVWRGGSGAVLARASYYSPFNRTVWLFDSFEGNPLPTKDDAEIVHQRYHEGWNRADARMVQDLFASLAIPKDRYRLVKGWYKDTLPGIAFPPIAMIHFDADMYDAAKLCLEKCYDMLEPGGYIVFNPWEAREGVRRAMNELMRIKGVNLPSFPVDHVARYFIKAT